MFVLDDRYNTVVAFLTGVDIGLDGRLLEGFDAWLQQRLLGYQTNFHWSAVIGAKVLGVDVSEHWRESIDDGFDDRAKALLLADLISFLGDRSS